MTKNRLWVLLLATFFILSACAAPNPESAPAAEEAPAADRASDAAQISTDGICETYNESPMLAEQVAAGELPPVAERLPVNPVVVEPYAEIGQYGGEMLDLYAGGRLAECR